MYVVCVCAHARARVCVFMCVRVRARVAILVANTRGLWSPVYNLRITNMCSEDDVFTDDVLLSVFIYLFIYLFVYDRMTAAPGHGLLGKC